MCKEGTLTTYLKSKDGVRGWAGEGGTGVARWYAIWTPAFGPSAHCAVPGANPQSLYHLLQPWLGNSGATALSRALMDKWALTNTLGALTRPNACVGDCIWKT